MIASALEASGLRTGLYTSPHLLEPTERIRLGGADISRDRFVDVVLTVHNCAESMVAAGTLDMHPTYFETITAMGFVAFAEAGVEWAVVEVGLGGRLDATNLVDLAVTVITRIDYDHMGILGSTLPEIAREKAGIFRRCVPAVIAAQRARKVMKRNAPKPGTKGRATFLRWLTFLAALLLVAKGEFSQSEAAIGAFGEEDAVL